MTTAKTNLWAAWIGGLLIVSGLAAMAQGPSPCTTPVALGAISYGPIPKLSAPYTATLTTMHDQVQADGSLIHGSVTTHQARDAAGRLWQERSLGCQPGPDGVRHPVIQTMVYDPATGTTISWKEDDPAKVLQVVHTPAVKLPPVTTDPSKEAGARRAMEEMGIHSEDLGSKKIAGVMAQGTRTMQTVGVQAGINKPIQILRETWVAKDLDLAMLSINDNSRNGRTTVEVVDLKQGDPAPTLFAAPAGYKVEENKPAQ